ncbi:PREDICTED: vitamin K epoxide reductase complex subunit 1-like, partial [Priapulus caudatus]|uniref:vitamin-K-epoxide reductase (warfarin-sensitive) n=1 Tax=Priapulus caudatus TaxID=37621 RepID=A0ABM1EQJ4_PRICU
DFNNSFSCSKVLTSRYGRGFGVLEYATGKDHWLNQPNSVFGVIFYTMFMIIGESRKLSVSNLQVYMAISSNFMSIYLACILFFILEDFCIVCVATYVINFVLLLLAFKKLYLVRDKFVVHTKQVQKKTL